MQTKHVSVCFGGEFDLEIILKGISSEMFQVKYINRIKYELGNFSKLYGF
jgi:hypothetical protein